MDDAQRWLHAHTWISAFLPRHVQGVQLLLDGVVDYLPNPLEVSNYALDTAREEEKVTWRCQM